MRDYLTLAEVLAFDKLVPWLRKYVAHDSPDTPFKK
jgi:hypothetical protein